MLSVDPQKILRRFFCIRHYYLSEPGVQSHGRVAGVLREIEVGRPPELLLDDEGLLEQLEPAGQELVLDLQEVALAHVHLERLVDDGEARVILDVLPATVAMGDDSYKYKRRK